jgi:pseudouridine synthase
MERLQKIIARAGIASRRHAEELIQEGRVKVNGKAVTELGTKVDVAKDRITVDGKPLKQETKKYYILLHKPRGYVTTMADPQGRKTVSDLVKDIPVRLYPIGRLDYDTEGLLLMTNDGDLTFALTHPKHEINKTYAVRVTGIPKTGDLELIARGVELEDGITAPAEVALVDIIDGNAILEITIHEGRNRQVRRMCEKIGCPVIRLKRKQLAFLTLDKVARGHYRHLTTKEIERLKKLTQEGKEKKLAGKVNTFKATGLKS